MSSLYLRLLVFLDQVEIQRFLEITIDSDMDDRHQFVCTSIKKQFRTITPQQPFLVNTTLDHIILVQKNRSYYPHLKFYEFIIIVSIKPSETSKLYFPQWRTAWALLLSKVHQNTTLCIHKFLDGDRAMGVFLISKSE